ncbi:MAG TPA: FtsK/SpoIIIE domain-containing protein [Pseudonocardiaceae bacterium]|nr:FtsK/SpoIIIE domain-containing protein [Pseudonocardiaceae bacterium]
MGAHSFSTLLLGGLGLALAVWLLHKLGRALAAIAETLAAAAVVLVALWWVVKVLVWLVKQLVIHPRTTGTVLVFAAWWLWLGWPSLALTGGAVLLALVTWRLVDMVSFDQWAGRWLRAWWMRWTVYDPKLPGWLHACGLTIRDAAVPVAVTVTLVGRRKVQREQSSAAVQVPKVLGVRSGASWDEVRVGLVPGQKPEDYDEAARALASARKVARCQVREISPNVVSIDFQRRNLLADPVSCGELADVSGESVDLRRAWAGRTEYAQDWYLPLAGPGAHVLCAGATGAGKNSVMWAPLVSVAPAIRDGLVRVSGIDPKGMELAYGRGIFTRYAVAGKESVELLDDLIACMDRRKAEFAGHVRSVPISREHPLEVLEFDEIGALTRYTDRKTRELISERVALLTTQGRALGFTVRGYVQEPTKDTVPVRELFPRRICLRVTAKSHVGMVLGDQAYERGAWANRIPESDAGVGYVWGEGIREPLRVRAGWVPDESVKALEAFVTGGQVVAFPTEPKGAAA